MQPRREQVTLKQKLDRYHVRHGHDSGSKYDTEINAVHLPIESIHFSIQVLQKGQTMQ